MKILYVTTIGATMGFFKNLIKELIDEGNIVDIATNESISKIPDCYREWGCKVFQISTSRSPFSFGNVKAIKQIRNIAGNYDIVHCHTPLAGMATRFGCRPLRKKGIKVFYTAHGFHFYKGAPLKNWLIYYPMEKFCSRFTDVLITINREDFEFAKQKMKAKRIEYVPGVGIDVQKFANTVVDKKVKRKEIGVPENVFMLLSVGELNENKNHRAVIKAIGKLDFRQNIYYVIAGMGDQKDSLESLASDLEVNLILLGFRSDVAELYKIADCYVLPSLREGLNVSIMEALASGLSCIVSKIRGNLDLVDDSFSFNPTNVEEVKEKITLIMKTEMSNSVEKNIKKSQTFDVNAINQMVKKIYVGILAEKK